MLSFFFSILENDADRQVFAALYVQYHTKLESIAIRILKNQSDAEDAVQNTFIQVIRHFEKINQIPCEDLLFWLISIVKNEAYMILRKIPNTVSLEDYPCTLQVVEDVSNYTELVELFTKLPDTYRRVLEMKMLLGYTDKEISEHLGITETAVSTRASRGRELLRKILEKEGFSYDR